MGACQRLMTRARRSGAVIGWPQCQIVSSPGIVDRRRLEQAEIVARAVYNSVNENCSLFDNIENQIVLDDKITITEIKQRCILRDATKIRVGS